MSAFKKADDAAYEEASKLIKHALEVCKKEGWREYTHTHIVMHTSMRDYLDIVFYCSFV